MRRLHLYTLLTILLALPALMIPATAITAEDFQEITVKKGETLSVISKKHLADPRRWRELLKYNNVPKPDLIFPGMKLKIPAFLSKNPVATVQYTRVVAEYLQAAARGWNPTRPQLSLFPNDQVRTRQTGLLRLLIKNGVLTLSKNSIIVLNRENIDKQQASTKVLLQKGRLHTSFRKSPGSTRPGLQIVTPSAIAAVRGTELMTAVDEDENTMVGCYEGLVGVSAEGKTVEVPAGYGTFVKKGQPPSEPFLLPAAPSLDENE